MFSLITKWSPWSATGRDTIGADRVFESTEDSLVATFKANGVLNETGLMRLPTLFVQETSFKGDQIARLGTVTRARNSGRNVVIDYAYDTTVPGIPNSLLEDILVDLDLSKNQLMHTHWSIKEADLCRALMRIAQVKRPQPTIFRISEYESIEPVLVSAMMPFDASFNKVYARLKAVAEEVGMKCRRADDIWDQPEVMQDVVNLIDKSRVVIADCSNRNPNVFYEIGIAHTLGREVILITQNEADIPFDLRHLRYVKYLANAQGLRALGTTLKPRLEEMAP